jgi:MGT family glycosyltransferase
MIAAMPVSWAGGTASTNVRRIALPLYDRGADPSASPLALPGPGFVYATLGTVNRDADAVASLLSALGDVASDVVLTTGSILSPADLENVPANVRVARYIPNSRLLPRARAVVHHGGFNTLLGALRFGLPQVLLPMDADQPLNAARAEELGFAEVVSPGQRTPATVTAAVERVLEQPHFAARARAMQADIDALEPVAAAVDALAAVAAKPNGTPSAG